MAREYYLYNQMYYNKVLMYDTETKLAMLIDFEANSNQSSVRWVFERDEDVDGTIGNRIKNAESLTFLTAEPNASEVTLKPDMEIKGNYTNKWFLSRRAEDQDEFNTTIESAASGELLAYKNNSIQTDTKGQMWRFVKVKKVIPSTGSGSGVPARTDGQNYISYNSDDEQ